MKPILTTPFLCEKDWGGERLRQYGKKLTAKHTGESWELSAHPNGECLLEGRPMSAWLAEHGECLGPAAQGGAFPLLIKLIDAHQTLSVQVHPDDAMARDFGDPYGKTEAWVVLEAPPGAELILGVDCTPAQMRSALLDGTMESRLRRIPVKPGDCVFIPAGTVHAITEGLMVYEVQQSSDRTFRLHAWGRDAQLHIEESLRAMAILARGAGLVTPQESTLPGARCERLVACDAFVLERLTLTGTLHEKTDGRRFYAYTALAGGVLHHAEVTLPYERGDTLLVPADAGEYTLRGGQLLRAYLP